MPATSDDHQLTQLRLRVASKWKLVSGAIHFALFLGIFIAFTISTFSSVSAHPPANYPSASANAPSPTISSNSGSKSASLNNVDDTRFQEILTNLYTHIQKYEQNSPSSSSDPNAPHQDHLISERVKEFLSKMEQQAAHNKQENLKVNFAANGKTMGSENEENNLNMINMKTHTANAASEQLQQQQTQQQTPSGGTHYQMPIAETVGVAGGGGGVPTASQKMVKLDTYSTLTEKRSGEGEVTARGEDTLASVQSNKYSLSSLGTLGPSVTRKVSSVLSSDSAKSSSVNSVVGGGGGNVGVVSSLPVSSNSVSSGVGLVESNSLYELLVSIDSRVQKLQDNLVYYRNTPKPVHSTASQLNPIFTNYLSLIKAQVLNIESTIEAKFSNMEHKFSNVEIEDGIWKKTINWKLEEMASKLSQNENKLSFSNDQIMNKMDLFERNFQIVTNDFFAKFLLVNEKLNKIELSLQTKWNDLEVKLRNNFAFDSYHRQAQKTSSFFKPELVESAGHAEQAFKEQSNALPTNEQITRGTATAATSTSTTTTTNEQFVAKKPAEQAKPESIPGVGSKISWNKQSVIKPANVTNLSDRLKFAQRFLKLMNSKTNGTVHSRKLYNSSMLLETLGAPPSLTSGANALMNDAPAAENVSENKASHGNLLQRPTPESVTNGNGTGKGSEKQQSQMFNQNYRLAQAAVPTIGSQPENGSTSQAGANNRNIDTLDGAEFINRNEHTSGQREVLVSSRGKPETANPNLKSIGCEHLRSVIKDIPKDEESRFYSVCKQIMNGTALLEMFPPTETHHDNNQQFEGREGILEKRELNEQVLVDSVKETIPPSSERPNPIEETLNQLNEIKTDKLEELDSKLQFFSTKIINIVQEMWLSSQASENYLKESLALANKTKIMMKEEFAKLQVSVKPIQQLATLAEEIREPIVNRLTELTTALNNSMEVILNTQAGFINSCRFIRDEDIQLFEVLDYFVNETALQRNQQQTQFAQFNKSFEFLLVKLDAVNRKTIEGVRSETMKVLEHIKGELQHQISSITSGANRAQSILAAGAEHMSRVSAGDDPSSNECFISKKEFASFCVDDKMFSSVMDAAAANAGQHSSLDKDHSGVQAELEIQYSNGTRGTAGIEINNGNEN